MGAQPWTDERIELVRALAAQKLSASQIGARVGATRNAVIGLCHRRGIALRAAVSAKGTLPKPPHVPPPLPVVPVIRKAAPIPEPAPLGALRQLVGHGQCRWVHGDAKAEWRMCANETGEGSAWCAHHRARIYDRTEHAARSKHRAKRTLLSVA